MASAGKIVLGTRGSELALAQTRLVREAIAKISPEIVIEVVVIKTSGDERSTVPINDLHAGRKGMFTREIERALLRGQIDAAVHSAKDLPSEMDSELMIAAVLPRANVEDVLIAKTAKTFDALPLHATIGTGSVRRNYQLREARDDLRIEDLRGNVPTRLRKLTDSDWAGIVLARAGLDRLGFATAASLPFNVIPLPLTQFVPAGGQGVIALQIRGNDSRTFASLGAVDDRETNLCLAAEREFLRLLQVDCNAPVGVHASIRDESMTMTAQLFEPHYRTACATHDVAAGAPLALAAELFARTNG